MHSCTPHVANTKTTHIVIGADLSWVSVMSVYWAALTESLAVQATAQPPGYKPYILSSLPLNFTRLHEALCAPSWHEPWSPP